MPAVEAGLRWSRPDTPHDPFERTIEQTRERAGNLLGLVVAAAQTTTPVKRHRHHHLCLLELVAKPGPNTSGQLGAQKVESAVLQTVNDPIERRLEAPAGDKAVDGGGATAAVSTEEAVRQGHGFEGTPTGGAAAVAKSSELRSAGVTQAEVEGVVVG
jgi:hypothetical protein